MSTPIGLSCKRCNKKPRGKIKVENAKRYEPYCSFHCQEWHRLELASSYVRSLPGYLK